MPFVESSRMERRVGLMRDYDTGAFSVTELCARYGIDRSTFYLCERSLTDPRYSKYPPLPVLACPGYEPREPDDKLSK